MKQEAALKLRGACLSAGLAFLFSATIAAEPDFLLFVDVDRASATVIANNVPLKEVIEAIALQTGIVVYSRAALDARVTYAIFDVTIPELVRRILKDRNFTLHFVSDAVTGASVFGSRLWILAGDATSTTTLWSVGEPAREWTLRNAAGNAERNRLRAISSIPTWEDSPDIDPDVLVALNDPAVSVREEAVHVLGELNLPQGRAYLRNALYDHDTRVRVAAIEAIADSGGDDAAILLAALLGDPDQAIRSEVIHAMAEIGSGRADYYLQLALSDADAVNRETAAAYLAEIATTRRASRF